MKHSLIPPGLVFGVALVAASGAAAQTFPVTVDSCGSPITFAAPPQRALIHDLNMTEMALSLGLQKRMVGVSGISGWYKSRPEVDKALGGIPEIAARQPTLENILAARPDFFFAGWNYGMSVGGDVTPTVLKRYGIPTLVLGESCNHVDKTRPRASMELLYGDYIKLGTIFGKEAAARAQVDAWKQRVARLPRAPGGRPTRVFLYDSGEDRPLTAGRFAMPTAMIEAAGARNVMDDLDSSWATVSWEAVAARDPEFLVLLDYRNDGGAAKLMQFLQQHPLMRHVDAVRNRRYVALRYEELTPGPANIGALEKMAKALAR
ncbi:ABC transporter substrate-binding protein [Pelomonas sp. KK5]|uniref:ABC transporter substrate-binding protein n=1 Tax=Pelomonas sp. KK5 TaxID=1855730 RepID=UPI00097BC5B3|nr:ABC transporter substrate-binding protein [Pelomonas sp. KK5]